MLSNAYFLAKFRFDTAENEPAKNLLIFPNGVVVAADPAGGPAARVESGHRTRGSTQLRIFGLHALEPVVLSGLLHSAKYSL